MGISEEDAQRLRAAAMDKTLSGDVKGAANIAAIHDMVTGKPARILIPAKQEMRRGRNSQTVRPGSFLGPRASLTSFNSSRKPTPAPS